MKRRGVETVKLPIDVHASENRQTQCSRCLGRQGGDGLALDPPGQEAFQLWIADEILDSERQALDESSHGVVKSANVFDGLIDEPIDCAHRTGHEQRVRVGKVAVHRLASDSESAGDIGEA